jgi:FkbH-like protein
MKVALRLTALVIDTVGWLYPLILMLLAGLCVASLTGSMLTSSFVLVAALPLLYLFWLFLFLCFSAVGAKLLFLSFEKPKVLKVNLNFPSPRDLGLFLDASRILTLYRLGLFMQRLPILNYSVLAPILFRWMNTLVLRAYAPSIHVGKNCLMISRLQDPDLTYIGNHVVIGADCYIAAHALNTSGGTLEYTSEPIEIGDHTTIGGNTRIGMGVKIGRGAVIEMGSNVLPFTRIGADEVWGGNPAIFLRTATRNLGRIEQPIARRHHTSEAKGLVPLSDGLDHSDGLDQLRQVQPFAVEQDGKQLPEITALGINSSDVDAIIAKALRMPLSDLTDQVNSETCIDWDSLAKMAMAAALYDRFAIRIPPKDIFRMNSRQAIVQLILTHTVRHADVSSSNSSLSSSLKTEHVVTESNTSGSVLDIPANPELLPLHDPEVVTQTLAQRFQDSSPIATDRKLLIVATFVAQSVGSTIELWCRAFHLPVQVEFLEYDQVEPTLLSDYSAFWSNTNGLNLVLTRPEDLISDQDESGMLRGQQLLAAIKSHARRKPGLVVSNLPPLISSFSHTTASQVEKLRTWWQTQLEQIDGVHILDFASVVETIGKLNARDVSLEVIARSPYSQVVYQQLGIAIARLVRNRYLPAKKVLALDCDQTLWGGRIGEDGVDGLAMGDDHPGRSFRLFQKLALELKKRGILLVLVSKNEEADVWQVFEQHPGMVLQRSDLAGYRINWQAKSKNLCELAQELNLGLDSFVFVDDSAAERLEVETNTPGVTVVPMPADPIHYVETLSKLWCFDVSNLTAEDAMRTQLMLQEQQRQALQKDTMNLDSYLQALELVVDMRLADERDLPRVAQLTQKTNQFNLSLIRRSLPEIQELQSNSSILVLNVKDKFGDYGLVGVAIFQPRSDQLYLDTFLISCRALGRGVEEAFLRAVFDIARQQNLKTIKAFYSMGPRNQQVQQFLIRLGFTQDQTGCFIADVAAAPEHPRHVMVNASYPAYQPEPFKRDRVTLVE